MTIYWYELLFLILWLTVPPLLIGIAVLGALLVTGGRPHRQRFWLVVIMFVGLTLLLTLALMSSHIHLPGPSLGVRDVQIFGKRTVWAPFAFVAAALAFPLPVWWLFRAGKKCSDAFG